MGPSILAGAAALLLFLTWSLRRRTPPALLRSTDASAIAALNRAQIALLRAGPGRSDAAPATGTAPSAGAAARRTADEIADGVIPPPADARQRAQLKARLEQQLRGDGQQRLQAMGIARRWGQPDVLSVLRRGLRDVDPRVVREAARGLERFRCCPCSAARVRPQLPLPRNVSRTR
ncbi:MAG: HEAT repeat domain-containing protein [Prochlorococcaceae cyanobacterium]